MDLGAYIQIDELDKVAKVNGISIPRLRGYRLMKDEKPMGREGFAQLFQIAKWRRLMICARQSRFGV